MILTPWGLIPLCRQLETVQVSSDICCMCVKPFILSHSCLVPYVHVSLSVYKSLRSDSPIVDD